jgi:hypothetical protein
VVGQRTSLTPTPAEEEQLPRIRKRRLCVWALFLCMPVVWLVPSEWQGNVALLWLIAFSVAASLVSFSRCRKCRNFYHRSRGVGLVNVWTHHCLSCGLPLRSRPRGVKSN